MLAPNVIVLLHGSDQALDQLHVTLECAGFRVFTGLADDVSNGRLDLESLVWRGQVDVIVWDLAEPFHASWAALCRARLLPGVQRCRFVITSGVGSMDHLVTQDDVYRVFGMPGRPDSSTLRMH